MPHSERLQGANIIDAGKLSPYWGEHIVRYVYAASFVRDKLVLDIACGTGYGLTIIKGKARYAVGVDIDLEAAKAAHAECDAKASVILGNGLGLPFEDGIFDVVTSFETLEHLHDRPLFLAELHRVLRPEGRLVLSTPNANYTMPINGKPSNPFHIFEYKPAELRSELDPYFTIDNLLGQMQAQDNRLRIPPFYEAQKRLPKDLSTQSRLFLWKVMNKLPLSIRETVSSLIWKKPFYPTEDDYIFSTETVEHAPVLMAVCTKKNSIQ